jgi:O-antigen/teichoic acid export membrane protein
MARYLTVTEYSLLASVFVIVYISSVFSESIQNFVVTYVGREEEESKLKNLVNRLIKKMTKFAILVIACYLVLAIWLSRILQIEYFTLSLGALILAFSILLPITRGVMQGKKKFFKLSGNMISEALIKLVVGLGFALLGFGVRGAILGVIIASTISFLISIFQISWINKTTEKTITEKVSYSKFLPAFILTSVVVVFYSLDVWIARIFFEPEISGAYALASILGKVLFWVTIPVSKAMLSISSNSKQDKPKNVFKTALIILMIICIGTLIFFFLFPNFLINFFSGKNIESATKILFYEGVSFSLIAISNLILLYKLSINKIKSYWIMVIPLITEILLLVFFSSNLITFSVAFLISSMFFLLISLIFYLINRKTE